MKKLTLTLLALATCLLMAAPSFAQSAVPTQPPGLDEIGQLRDLLTHYRDRLADERQYDPAAHDRLTGQTRALTSQLRQKLETRFNAVRQAKGVSVRSLLPDDAKLDGTQDLRQAIQDILDKHPVVILDGSDDAARPLVYGVACNDQKAGLVVPPGHTLIGKENAVIRRLPSAGQTVRVEAGGVVIGLTIDGNKQAHWPAFEDKIGKSDMGIRLAQRAAAVDCLVYDIPGIAFGTYNNQNIFWRNVARNAGHIDLKFNATFYQGKWDNYSGDGFYARGYGNLVMDSQAYDCFRWGYTTCHGKSGAAAYINSTMHNSLWRTYGFIDIEDCRDDPVGTMMIDMHATQGSLTITGSRNALVFNSSAGSIHGIQADGLLVAGSQTHGGGLGFGGWTSVRNAMVRGGDRPVIVGNTIVKSGVSSGIANVSDWSLSVVSADAEGLAAGNVLREYQGPMGKGPGAKFENITHTDNHVEYGQWIQSDQTISQERAQATDPIRQRNMQAFARNAAALAGELGAKGQIARMVFPQVKASYIRDERNVGPQEQWQQSGRRPAGDQLRPIYLGEHWDTQYGTYHGHAWYFTTFQVDGDDYHVADRVYLLFGGVDPECRVYINGQLVGEHEGWNKPFLMEIKRTDGPIRWDDSATNDLAIHIHSPSGMGGIYGQVALLLTRGDEPTHASAGAPASADSASQQSTPTATPAPAGTYKPVQADFAADVRQVRTFHNSARVGHLKDGGGVQLRGEGGIVSQQATGPGVYHVKFRLNESHERFQYHVPQFIIRHTAPAKLPKATTLNGLADFYGLTWNVSGQVTLFRHDAATKKNHTLGQWQQPGPDSPARYARDQDMDLTIVVPPPGGELRVYLKQDGTQGEPTCTFTLPADAPAQGSFGFYNPKWFSLVHILALDYTPASQ